MTSCHACLMVGFDNGVVRVWLDVYKCKQKRF